MIEQKRQWLTDITWDSIVGLNRTLCQAQKMEPLINAKTFSAAQESWERAGQKAMDLTEALTICRDTRDRTPFTFNNGNTFAALARHLVEECLRNAPALEGQILRTTISHYVAGTVGKKELQQVLTELALHFQLAPAPVRVPVSPSPAPAPAPVPAPSAGGRLTEAQPLA